MNKRRVRNNKPMVMRFVLLSVGLFSIAELIAKFSLLGQNI